MVRKFFSLFNKEIGGLHEAAFLLGLSTLASQVLALLRDRLLAASFGASGELDVYYAAFRVPDLIYVSLASFVSVTVLIPFIIERLSGGKEVEVRRFLDQILTVFIVVMVVVSGAAFFALPYISPLLAPGFSAEQLALLSTLSRFLLLSPFLLGLSNLFGAVTQATRKFFIYALSPILYNLGIIVGIIWLYPRWGLVGIGAGVVVGAFLHLAIQWPSVYRARLFPGLTSSFSAVELWRVVAVSLPRTLTLSAHQLSLAVIVALASASGRGAVSVFNLSFNLQSVPLAIVGVSYSVAAFPALTKMFSAGEHEKFVEQISATIRHIIFWSMPAMVFFIVLRAQIVRVLLGAGEFSWADTRLTAAALAVFSVSVLAQSLVLLFVRGYYAAGKTARPLVANTASSALIVVLAFAFVWLFKNIPVFEYFFEALLRIGDLPGTVVVMLPLAFSAGLLINACIFWCFFQRDFGSFPKDVYNTLFQTFSASVLGGAAAYQTLDSLGMIFDINTFWGIFLQGFVAGILGIVVWIVILRLSDNQEIKDVTRVVHRKFWKRVPVMPSPEEL
ncbi:MAG TPA: lipid II flippase MurJ [Candidatus Paceibacterota bacterium]|nr:lipid II flippase MurJ [Candidatus Paceibacterota bacterium]